MEMDQGPAPDDSFSKQDNVSQRKEEMSNLSTASHSVSHLLSQSKSEADTKDHSSSGLTLISGISENRLILDENQPDEAESSSMEEVSGNSSNEILVSPEDEAEISRNLKVLFDEFDQQPHKRKEILIRMVEVFQNQSKRWGRIWTEEYFNYFQELARKILEEGIPEDDSPCPQSEEAQILSDFDHNELENVESNSFCNQSFDHALISGPYSANIRTQPIEDNSFNTIYEDIQPKKSNKTKPQDLTFQFLPEEESYFCKRQCQPPVQNDQAYDPNRKVFEEIEQCYRTLLNELQNELLRPPIPPFAPSPSPLYSPSLPLHLPLSSSPISDLSLETSETRIIRDLTSSISTPDSFDKWKILPNNLECPQIHDFSHPFIANSTDLAPDKAKQLHHQLQPVSDHLAVPTNPSSDHRLLLLEPKQKTRDTWTCQAVVLKALPDDYGGEGGDPGSDTSGASDIRSLVHYQATKLCLEVRFTRICNGNFPQLKIGLKSTEQRPARRKRKSPDWKRKRKPYVLNPPTFRATSFVPCPVNLDTTNVDNVIDYCQYAFNPDLLRLPFDQVPRDNEEEQGGFVNDDIRRAALHEVMPRGYEGEHEPGGFLDEPIQDICDSNDNSLPGFLRRRPP